MVDLQNENLHNYWRSKGVKVEVAADFPPLESWWCPSFVELPHEHKSTQHKQYRRKR